MRRWLSTRAIIIRFSYVFYIYSCYGIRQKFLFCSHEGVLLYRSALISHLFTTSGCRLYNHRRRGGVFLKS